MQNTPVTNVSDLKPYFSSMADDPDMVELITEYVDSFPATVNKIHQTLEQRAFEDLGRIAHQLKGSGGGYGFPEISEAASRLEAQVKSPSMATETLQLGIQKSVQELVSLLGMARAT